MMGSVDARVRSCDDAANVESRPTESDGGRSCGRSHTEHAAGLQGQHQLAAISSSGSGRDA